MSKLSVTFNTVVLKCGPWTSSGSITSELVRNANPSVFLQTYCIKHSGGMACKLYLTNTPGDSDAPASPGTTAVDALLAYSKLNLPSHIALNPLQISTAVAKLDQPTSWYILQTWLFCLLFEMPFCLLFIYLNPSRLVQKHLFHEVFLNSTCPYLWSTS